MAVKLKNKNLERGSGKKRPLYHQITDCLRELIESEKLFPGEPLPTVSHMVNYWGVNYRTVNSALEQLRSEGLIRWEPSRGEKPIVIKSSRTQTTIMYIRWGSDSLSIEMIEGINQYGSENKLECQIIDACENHNCYFGAIETAFRHVGGILMMPIYAPQIKKVLKIAIKSGVSFVFLNREVRNIEASSVSVDHLAGTHKAVTHLLRLHHRPVYFMGYNNHTRSATYRYDGYDGWATAMLEAGFTELHRYTINIQFNEECDAQKYSTPFNEAALNFFIKQDDPPYSIFAMNDYIALSIYQAAEKAKLEIGKDISLASFGDLPICKQFNVPLTSVAQNNQKVGYEGAKLLHMHMKGLLKQPIYQKIPGELHIRASSDVTKPKS